MSKDWPSSSWVIDQNNILTILIHNLKTNGSTKISIPWTICYKMHIFFSFKKDVDYFKIEHKKCYFGGGLGCRSP